MEKKISQEIINEANSFKNDYKLQTFSNGFHIRLPSFPKKHEQNKSSFKNKYNPLSGEKLSKKNLFQNQII